jgi:hypothetical protein
MKNYILKINFYLLLIFTGNITAEKLYADEATLWRDSNILKEGLTESQWVMFIGAEIMRLDPITNFSLPRQGLGERTETLYGPVLGFARKWYIIGNLTTTTEPMAYYLQNDDTKVELPTNDAISTYKVSEFSEKYQYFGLRIAQSIGYTFEFDSFNFEPFAQAYIGQGFNRTKIYYLWDTKLASEYQEFDSTVRENITHQGFAAGFQLIGKNGYMSFVKVSKNTLTFKKRESKSTQTVDGVTTSSESKESLNEDLEKLSVSLGLGYIF